MEKRKIIALILSLILFFCYSVISADEPPTPPHRFKGFVFDENGNFFPDNTIISAKIGSTYHYTNVINGRYGFSNLTEPFEIEGNEGDLVTFYINDNITGQTTTWTTGGLNDAGSKYLNLSFDTTSPIISSVSISSIGETQATVTWNTDESSTSQVNYGKTTSLGSYKSDASYVTEHTITLSDLEDGTKYYMEVVSTDRSENSATDDNSGSYYSFTTTESSSGGDNGGGGNGGGGGGGLPPPIVITNTKPTADAGGPYYSAILTVTFDASKSSDSDGNITSYIWDFGDSLTETTEDIRITHTYSDIDNYTITLTVTDDDGAKDTDSTFVLISVEDTDGDGWNDEAELYYGTDPNNGSNYPTDIDDDGVPDGWDADDDNDGLTDDEETELGINSLDDSDVIRIFNDYGVFFFIDTDADGVVDKYYKKGTTWLTTSLKNTDDEDIRLIDINNDGSYEYEYHISKNDIKAYVDTQPVDTNQDNTIYIGLITVVILVILVLFMFIRRRGK